MSNFGNLNRKKVLKDRQGWGQSKGSWLIEGLKIKTSTFLYGEGRRPLVLENVETDSAVAVDVGMVDSGDEGDFRGFEGVISREVDVQEKHPSSVGRVFRPQNSRLPVKLVFVVLRSSRTVRRRVSWQIYQFLFSI